jgi:hypothetical protein
VKNGRLEGKFGIGHTYESVKATKGGTIKMRE